MSSFKVGESVSYGPIKGIVIGLLENNNQEFCLFFADNVRPNFLTANEIINSASWFISNNFRSFLSKYFDSNLFVVAKQKRFLILPTQDLKINTIESKEMSLLHKRHLYLTLARHYLRTKASDEKIHRICERIEDLQKNIETNAQY